MKPGV